MKSEKSMHSMRFSIESQKVDSVEITLKPNLSYKSPNIILEDPFIMLCAIAALARKASSDM